MDVRMPDGRVITNVPEGTTRAQLMTKLKPPAPAESSTLANLGAGAVRGASRMGNVLLDAASAPAGLVFPEAVKDFKAWRHGGADLMDQQHKGSAAYTAGDIGAQVAMTAPVGLVLGAGVKAVSSLPKVLQVAKALASGGGSAMMRAGTGAATGAASMALTNPDDIAAGAVGGAVMPTVASGLARVVKPQTDKMVKALMEQGVRMTPGQILGGGWRKAEEGARSIPVLGDAIAAAERRGVEDFNRAAINRVLEPLGRALPKGAPVGYEGVERAHAVVSRAYDNLLPKLSVAADPDFANDLLALKQMAANMPADRAAQFDRILQRDVLDRLTGQGLGTGATAKVIESRLGESIRAYSRSESGDERLLGDALKETQAAFRRLLERSNPALADDMKKINTAYANLLRVENAASRQGAKEGVFTPNQLGMGSRALDSSLRKRSSAHGEALMQDLAEQGQKVIGSKLPDSGTANRLMLGGATLGGGYLMNPAVPAATLTGAALYTNPANKVIEAMLTKRPKGASAAADVIRRRAAQAMTVGSVPAMND